MGVQLQQPEMRCPECHSTRCRRSKRTGAIYCLQCAGIPYSEEEIAAMNREVFVNE